MLKRTVMHACCSVQLTVGVGLMLPIVTLVLRLVVGLVVVDDSSIVDTLRSGDSDSAVAAVTAGVTVAVSRPTVDLRPPLYLMLLLLPQVWLDTAIKLGVAATTIDLGSSSCIHSY
jgi:hypothetical protein